MITHTTFSRHAYARVIERLTMEPDDLADLLDWNLAVKIGEEKGTRRIHRLFYSDEDRQCFVAIQDERTKTIVTLLPIDYYETLVAKVPQPSIEEAQRIVSSEAECASDGDIVVSTGSRPKTRPPQLVSFKLSGTFMNLQRAPRSVNLGSCSSVPYGGSIARLLQDPQFIEQVITKLRAKMKPDEYIVGVAIRRGRKEQPIWIALDDDGEWNNMENGSPAVDKNGHEDLK